MSVWRCCRRCCMACRSRCFACFPAEESARDCCSKAFIAESHCVCMRCSESRILWPSLLSVDSAAAYPGVCSRIVCEWTKAILSVPCACAPSATGAATTSPTHVHTVTTHLIAVSPRERPVSVAPPSSARGVRSEEVAQLEVQLEPRRRAAEGIRAVEAVRPVDPDGPEGRNDAQADAGTTEQPRRIELAGVRPHVPRVHEHVDVEHLRQPRADLARHGEIRPAERIGRRLAVDGGRIVSLGRDGELIIATQRDAVLHTAHGEQLVEEGGVPEHQSRTRRQAHIEADGCLACCTTPLIM